jgi:hypothetical protein
MRGRFDPSPLFFSSYVQTLLFFSIQQSKIPFFRSFAHTLHTWRNLNLYPAVNELETIIQRWMRDEGLSREEARSLAVDEIDFYSEEPTAWKGPNDSTQEYI